MAWQTKKLTDLVELVTKGTTPKTYGHAFTSDGVLFLRAEDVTNMHINLENITNHISNTTNNFLSRSKTKSGDVLLTIAGTIGRVAVVEPEMPEMNMNQAVALIRPKKEIDSYFLALLLRSDLLQAQVKNGTVKMAIPNFSLTMIKNLEIPLPSLSEQKEIVKELDEKMMKIAEAKQFRSEALAETEKILFQVLREIFNEGRQKFKIIDLGEVTKLVRGPFGGSLKKEIFVSEGDCVYEQGNVIDDDLNNFRYFITDKKFEEMKRFAVSAGDILMSCSGTIGKFAIIPDKFQKGIINQALLKITPKNTILVKYLKYALQDYLFKNNDHVKGMAIKNIAAVKELKKIHLPIPPLAQQQKIVAKLDELYARIKELRELQSSQLADLKSLERAYLREAFNGGLL